jgi:hypothetical protein
MRRKTFLIPLLMTGMVFLLAFTPGDKTKAAADEKLDLSVSGESVPISSFVNRSTFERRSLLPFERWARIKERKAKLSTCSAPNSTPSTNVAPANWLHWWEFFGTTLIDEFNPDWYLLSQCSEPPLPGSCNDFPFNTCTLYWNGKRICKVKAEAACGEMYPECFHPDLSTVVVTWYKTYP